MRKILNDHGFTLVEVMVSAALMGGLALGAMSFYQEQQKRLNYWEFQGKREYFRQAIMGQFLMMENSCLCYFGGSQPITFAFDPVAGKNYGSLSPSPAIPGIGSFINPTPFNNCVGSTMAAPILSKFVPGSTTLVGTDGIKLNSVELKRIELVGNAYEGDFEVKMESMKDVTGQKVKGLRYKVGVDVELVGSTVNFKGCSMNKKEIGSDNPTEQGWVTLPGGLILQWGKVFQGINKDSRKTIPYNRPFPNAVFSVVLSGTKDSGNSMRANYAAVFDFKTTSKDSFEVISSMDSTDYPTWIAIGK